MGPACAAKTNATQRLGHLPALTSTSSTPPVHITPCTSLFTICPMFEYTIFAHRWLSILSWEYSFKSLFEDNLPRELFWELSQQCKLESTFFISFLRVSTISRELFCKKALKNTHSRILSFKNTLLKLRRIIWCFSCWWWFWFDFYFKLLLVQILLHLLNCPQGNVNVHLPPLLPTTTHYQMESSTDEQETASAVMCALPITHQCQDTTDHITKFMAFHPVHHVPFLVGTFSFM